MRRHSGDLFYFIFFICYYIRFFFLVFQSPSTHPAIMSRPSSTSSAIASRYSIPVPSHTLEEDWRREGKAPQQRHVNSAEVASEGSLVTLFRRESPLNGHTAPHLTAQQRLALHILGLVGPEGGVILVFLVDFGLRVEITPKLDR
jgi:hypothetical protein